MQRDDLRAQIQSIEWSDMKLVNATKAAPDDSLEIVSAFVNTAGGHLVFGVMQTNGKPTILSRNGMN